MPTITIRNVPEALHQRLKARAKAHRRSLNAEALTVLDEGVRTSPTPPATQEEAMARLDALRESIRPIPSDLDPVLLIREDRDSDHGRL